MTKNIDKIVERMRETSAAWWRWNCLLHLSLWCETWHNLCSTLEGYVKNLMIPPGYLTGLSIKNFVLQMLVKRLGENFRILPSHKWTLIANLVSQMDKTATVRCLICCQEVNFERQNSWTNFFEEFLQK